MPNGAMVWIPQVCWEPLPRKPEPVNQLMKHYRHKVIFPGGGIPVKPEIPEIGSVAERCINIECPWT